MNEICIAPTDLLFAMRERADRESRELRRAIDIKNRIYQQVADHLDAGSNCRRHPRNGGNCRFHAWPGNCDDGPGDLLHPGVLPARGNERNHDQRPATERTGNDVCDLAARETVRATLSRDELREWQKRNSPVDGPRARTEVPFAGNYS